MAAHRNASSVLTLLLLLTGASIPHLSSPHPIITPGDVDSPAHANAGLTLSGDEERRDEERRSSQGGEAEQEEELFKDVDPKTLAAVLLEALNHSQVERREEAGEIKAEGAEVKKEEGYRQVRTMEGADRDRDGRQQLELLMAAQGKEQQKKMEEERKRAQEEEERMTEKVTSRTTSQTVQVRTEPQPAGAEVGKGAAPRPGQEEEEEEEQQLSPEELKSLEAMMKEFPRLDTAAKRKGDSGQNQRESRGYSSQNDIVPMNKGGKLAMSKKKLKWQEETQKALNMPSFRGGNFMDDFENSNYGNNAAQSQPPAEQEVMEGDEPEQEEEGKEDEEVLSPEEEEARAKAEQEEMRRQAAEAQRAKMEEEKLADIASDMLLRYMVKQNGGGGGSKKYSPSLSNAAEDKRSDEEQGAAGEEDDIDPQTIDKLIEISSKLHLPADDVVDILSDVEKKKKKDVPPELASRWQRPLTPLSPSPFSSDGGPSASQVASKQSSFPASKQSSPAVNLLKTWFQEKTSPKSQDRWLRPVNPLAANRNLWPRPQKSPSSIKEDLWRKSPQSFRAGYPSYPYIYPSFYQRKPYPDYYPFYLPPPPRPKPRYYIPKPAVALNDFLENSLDDARAFAPRRRYHSWVQPRLRSPPLGRQQQPYYSSYPLPPYPRAFQQAPIPKLRSPPWMPAISTQQRPSYYAALAPAPRRKEDYYVDQSDSSSSSSSSRAELEKYIRQILMNTPQMLD